MGASIRAFIDRSPFKVRGEVNTTTSVVSLKFVRKID